MTTPPDNGPQNNGLASAAVVSGMARELDALRRQLPPLRKLGERVGDLDDRISDLSHMVTAVANELHRRNGGTSDSAPSWLDLLHPTTVPSAGDPPDSDPGGDPDDTGDGDPGEAESPDPVEVARELLNALVDWVEQVYLRYADAANGLPECWLWHPPVIEELLWLRHAWMLAYRGENPPTALAWDWHDRYRPGAVRRINRDYGRCSLHNHSDDSNAEPPRVIARPAVEELAAWWADGAQTRSPRPSQAVREAARAAKQARIGGAR